MKLTDEQLDRIEEIMDEVEILSEPGQRSWIRALAAGMNELIEIYGHRANDLLENKEPMRNSLRVCDIWGLTDKIVSLSKAIDDLEAK